MVYVQLMPTSRKEKSSFLTCLHTLEQTGAKLCCSASAKILVLILAPVTL